MNPFFSEIVDKLKHEKYAGRLQKTSFSTTNSGAKGLFWEHTAIKKTLNPQFQLEVLLHIDIGVQRFPINGPPAEIKVGGVLNSMLWQNILRGTEDSHSY